jgi:hypothetical protein
MIGLRARGALANWLTPELEYATYASWMVPMRVLDQSEFGLFDSPETNFATY